MSASTPEALQYAHYEVISKLGQGAMGVVYLARDKRIGRRVALKIVRPQNIESVADAKEFFARLQREAELSGALNHPNIATLYEVGYERRLISFLAMEYVEGETLHSILAERKPLELERAIRIVEDVLDGLAYAHSAGVIHRDIKPANIVVRPDGRAKILDFGIARREDSSLTMSGSFVGTPNYMSPEQVKSMPLTSRIDLFSLGVVFYEMLTAVKPFAGDSMTAVMYNIVEKEPEPLSAHRDDAPGWLESFIRRMLAKDPNDRFESASDALTALRSRAAGERAVAEQPPVAVDAVVEQVAADVDRNEIVAPPKHGKRISALAGVAVLLIVSAPLIVIALLLQRESQRPVVARHTAQELRDFAAKKTALQNAAALAASGRYAEARSAYEQYLVRYPASAAAREALAKLPAGTVAAADEARPTAVAKPARKDEAEAKKPGVLKSFRNRVKSIFHRD